MSRTTVRVAAAACLTAAAFALVPLSVQAATSDVTDRHDIPVFVLERIEFVAGTGRFG